MSSNPKCENAVVSWTALHFLQPVPKYNHISQMDNWANLNLQTCIKAFAIGVLSWQPSNQFRLQEPMDLMTIEEKLESKEYGSKQEFLDDFQLIFDNCRVYNGADSGQLYSHFTNSTVCFQFSFLN